MKRIITVILALTLCLGFAIPAAAAETGGTRLADWTYKLFPDDGTVVLTKYTGSAKAVTVPDSFLLGGRTYDTVLYTNTVFRANTSITSVTIGPGVGYYNGSMRLLFGECSALTSVDLSAADTSGVTNMSYMFYNCTALKGVDLSAFDTSGVTTMRGMFCYCNRLSGLTGYENWDTGSLEDMNHMFDKVAYSVSASVPGTIDLSGWDLDQVKNTGWCFQTCRAQTILLPDNLGIMSAGFLNHAIRYAGTTFTVPAGVKKIGYAHTIYDFATNDFVEFRVAEGNTAYAAVDGILYSADGTEMLAVPRNKPFENNVYEIPEGVTFLGELSFSRNYNIHTLVLPDSYEIEYVPVYDPRYIVFDDTGNLNAGTNLSVAIYCYTGITHYVVKDTNPRYASLDGVIIPALKVSVADGTAPHVLEPKYPGVSERIVDLGRFRSDARLREHAAEIIRLTDENKEMHAACTRYLNAAGAAGQDLMQIVSDALDTDKAENFVRHLADREFGAGAGGEGTVQRRFLSAVTPVGVHTFYETADALCERKIVLHDELGLPAAVITAALCALALESGCRVIKCLCPLAPERKIDHLILPELSLGVFTSNERHPFPHENAKNVQCVRFLTKNETRLHKNRIRFTRRAQGEMLAEALRYQQKAKALHDALEQYYIDAMDFDSLAEYTERLIKTIFQ